MFIKIINQNNRFELRNLVHECLKIMILDLIFIMTNKGKDPFRKFKGNNLLKKLTDKFQIYLKIVLFVLTQLLLIHYI